MSNAFHWRNAPSQIAPEVQPSPKARTNPGKGGKKRPIEQLTPAGELVHVFPSISDAARATGVPDPNIVRAASGVRNSAGGYRWRYVSPAREILRDRHCGAYSKASPKETSHVL